MVIGIWSKTYDFKNVTILSVVFCIITLYRFSIIPNHLMWSMTLKQFKLLDWSSSSSSSCIIFSFKKQRKFQRISRNTLSFFLPQLFGELENLWNQDREFIVAIIALYVNVTYNNNNSTNNERRQKRPTNSFAIQVLVPCVDI